jgi:hypothetical protein
LLQSAENLFGSAIGQAAALLVQQGCAVSRDRSATPIGVLRICAKFSERPPTADDSQSSCASRLAKYVRKQAGGVARLRDERRKARIPERTPPMTTKALQTALLCGVLSLAATAAFAQSAEPSYKADPDVYKVIFEDANFRVIAVDRKKGVHDKLHAHPLPSVVYNVTDCKTRLATPDGKSVDRDAKAGTADAAPVTPGHTAENIGAADCKQILVEKK